jgi:DNA-directed RNA polymerase specialized sigma24 family protein
MTSNPQGCADIPAPVTPESHEAVMARLYREHNQSLIGFLMTRVDSEQEAQDVAHEAYVRMLQLDAPLRWSGSARLSCDETARRYV